MWLFFVCFSSFDTPTELENDESDIFIAEQPELPHMIITQIK